MGWWKRAIGKEPISSKIIGIYSKRKENNLDYYERAGLSEKIRESYLTWNNIDSQILVHKYQTDAYRIEFKSIKTVNTLYSYSSPRAENISHSYHLFEICAPLGDLGTSLVYHLKDLNNIHLRIMLTANSEKATLKYSDGTEVEYLK